MPTKKQQYEEFVRQYKGVYGSLPAGDKPVLFNVTGWFRNKHYEPDQMQTIMFVILSVLLMNIGGVSILFAIMKTDVLVASMFSLVVAMWIYKVLVLYGINEKKTTVFDGEFIEIEGRLIGVVLPTQEQERKLEEENFKQTSDLRKLLLAFNRARMHSTRNIVVISVGSTTAQCIFGDIAIPEIEFGIDRADPTKIRELLNSLPLRLDDVLVIMNSAGYGVKKDAGIVFNDNMMEYDTITTNIVERTVGGTGSNAAAMAFVELITDIHKSLEKSYVLAVVPRGDETMPQGGSHSKQRMLDLMDEDMDVVVLEVSGKQTKKYELVLSDDDDIDEMTPEEICKKMKEVKVLTKDGKTYGSDVVFQ